MTSGEFRGDQSMLPGFDDLSLALDAFEAEERVRQARAEASAVQAAVAPIQAVIASRYDHEIVPAREQIWDDTKVMLRNRRPSVRSFPRPRQSYDDPDVQLAWSFQALFAERDMNLTASVTADLKFHHLAEESEFDELQRALNYLDRGSAAFRRGKVPDELWGVAAEGKGRDKTIYCDALVSRIVAGALERGNSFRVSVMARVLGPDVFRDIFDLYFSPDRGTSKDLSLLRPDHVDIIYDELWNGYGGWKPISEPTLDDVHDYLCKKYLKDGVGEQYRKLAAANEIMQRSNPIAF